MPASFYNDSAYKLRQSEITKKAWRNGIYDSLRKPLEHRKCCNPACNKGFKAKPHNEKVYCSSSCSAIVNNSKRPKQFYFCEGCNKQIYGSNRKYCSVKCQCDYYYRHYITRWKQGLENGNRGITTKTLFGHIRRYLLKKYGEKCSNCGWNQRHPVTAKVPLEVDHIDGNSENNKEGNLRLICPNCHSLTPCFRNLNKGNGRSWRIKYLKRLETH